ncbi:lysophospholipid acyltransferase family protein [Paenibacillus sp. WQ 127069]|uniref:Lysophospholipid acyltransferase family protein n=1 Tax=Paenibacillus baimaensis TaxID=2982185 RepID=A0ABT2UTS5_9BACL|nr:lysophospholipid acyltransferase family protein [Paenibacillus sp. WQ 127069]MCU6798055.1 lysophospholipid acyltransferase family protein [Paenibacillus sp. WQ 127069]
MYDWIGKITENHLLIQKMAAWSRWIPKSCMLMLLGCAAAILQLSVFSKGMGIKVEANLSTLLKDRSAEELTRIRHQFFRNLVITLYEIIVESKYLEGSESWRFRVEGEDHLKEALQLGRGAIIYAPHEGNFFYYYWYLSQKYNCLTIATAESPELRPLYEQFQLMGCEGLDYDRTPPLLLLRKLKKHLKSNGVVFILGDFWRPTFPQSQFFGRKSRTPEGAALLSIDQRVPIIPFYGRRDQGFKHCLTFEQPLHLYACYLGSQRSEATQLLNRYMESVIRKHPEQWFYWFNVEERFKIDFTEEVEQKLEREKILRVSS